MKRLVLPLLSFFVALTVASNVLAGHPARSTQTAYRTVEVEGLQIFYREAGDRSKPTLLLLHGFPTSSHMFRNLIPKLAENYHVVAPDYPGFGSSSAPAADQFEYTFDNLAEVVDQFTEKMELEQYSLYLMDYGAPIGFRLATAHPERIQSLVIQNGNAYDEGIDNDFWQPIKKYWKQRNKVNGDALRSLLTMEATQWQYTHGVRDTSMISPDTWGHVQPLLDRPGNQEIQLALFHSYGSNPPLYPQWQEYLRKHQPPTLIVWGKNDAIFPAAGATPYRRDLPKVEMHLLDTGHFALEEDGDLIAEMMQDFLKKNL